MLIDTHCHLTARELAGRLDAVIGAAEAAGVTRMITVAEDAADARAALALLRPRPGLFLVAGVHPHRAARCTPEGLAEIADLWRNDDQAPGLARRIVAVGETGLDFHYDFAPRAQQEAVFRGHLELAIRLGRPVVIHARESELRVCEILAEYPALAGRAVFHCFSGDVTVTRRVLDLGGWVSFTGVVTFKKAETIQAAARYAPADRMMLETDAPYLSPEPVRKVRPNEPALIVHTARFVAELRGVAFEDLARVTTANAERFFGLTEG